VSKRVTIKSIAEDLGISHMTVSRALSDSPKVKEDTRRVVRQRARELGYVKSVVASAIRGDQTMIVGLLLPNLVNEFYARFADSLAKYLELRGQQLIIHLTNDDIDKERQAILKLREIQAHGVVMVPAPGMVEYEENYLRDLRIIQLIRKRALNISSTAALVDDSGAIIEAVHHLASQGHSRIAYIGGEPSLSSGYSRLSAFLGGMEEAGLVPRADTTLTDMPSFGMGYTSAQTLLNRDTATAIICGGFEISNGALSALLERGLNLPRDISFIGYGDPSFYRWVGGGVSTIKVPVEDLAGKTVELLGPEGSGRQDGPEGKSQKAELVIRQSSRADVCRP
jgi:LacI family transcriptional regulator